MQAVFGQVAYTICSILGITAGLCFPMLKHNAAKASADALYSIRKFSFGIVFTAFDGNLFYRVTYKLILGAVLLESSKNFETLIRKHRTSGEPFDLAKT